MRHPQAVFEFGRPVRFHAPIVPMHVWRRQVSPHRKLPGDDVRVALALGRRDGMKEPVVSGRAVAVNQAWGTQLEFPEEEVQRVEPMSPTVPLPKSHHGRQLAGW